jgi:ABC-type Fe3+ transport system permease subunit
VALSLLVCSLLIGLMGRSSMSVWILGLLGCMLATPGPLINLAIGHTLNRWMPSSLSFLSDRTLLGPILALQFRVLPIVFGLLWITRQRYLGRYGELLKLEEPMPWSKRCSVWIGYSKWSWLIAFWIGFSIAFGDLASYLLIQPPGVTTVAMRMFDLLHYGTKNREAGLAVALAIFGSVSSLAWLSAVPIRR